MRTIRIILGTVVSLALVVFGQLGAQEVEAKKGEPVALSVGDEAPDFDLPSSDGSNYKLSDVLKDGPVVLAWFPKADTPGCTRECKSLAENSEKLQQFKFKYFMISNDTVEDNTKFAEKYSADFPILSDVSKKVAEAYGVSSKFGFPNRHTFYIGTDGKILKIDRKVKPATTAEDIISSLEELEVDKVEST